MGEKIPIETDYLQRNTNEIDSRLLNCNIIGTENDIYKMLRESSCQSTILYPYIFHTIYLCHSKMGSNASTSFQIKNKKA